MEIMVLIHVLNVSSMKGQLLMDGHHHIRCELFPLALSIPLIECQCDDHGKNDRRNFYDNPFEFFFHDPEDNSVF